MSTTKTTYYAYFGSKLGYYSSYQPDYSWSFTQDIDKAKEYKTLNGVLDRLFHISPENNEHEYGGDKRQIEEKTSKNITSGNTSSITVTYKTLSFDETVALFKTKQTLQFEKKIEKREKQKTIDENIQEKERIKWDKIRTEITKKQEDFYFPKCEEIQKLLQTSEYEEKRRKFMLKDFIPDEFTLMFKNNSSNDFLSKFFILFKMFNTMKILLDNNQSFSAFDNQILVPNSEKEKVRRLFIDNGVFENNYCKFGKEKELFSI